MRTNGVNVMDIPKIYCDYLSTKDHSISFQDTDLIIPFQLNGTFSYFNTRLPLKDELYAKDTIFTTLDSSDWNPHYSLFGENERAMLNHNDDMAEKDHMENIPLTREDNQDGCFELVSVKQEKWDATIDAHISSCYTHEDHTITSNYNNDNDFVSTISLRGECSKFGRSVDSTTTSDGIHPLLYEPIASTIYALE